MLSTPQSGPRNPPPSPPPTPPAPDGRCNPVAAPCSSHRVRSSSLPPEKVRHSRKGSRSSRASSVEGREVRRAKELEEAARRQEGSGAGVGPYGSRAGGVAVSSSPCAQIAALHRRAGRCILLLARFVTRSKEEENGATTGEARAPPPLRDGLSCNDDRCGDLLISKSQQHGRSTF